MLILQNLQVQELCNDKPTHKTELLSSLSSSQIYFDILLLIIGVIVCIGCACVNGYNKMSRTADYSVCVWTQINVVNWIKNCVLKYKLFIRLAFDNYLDSSFTITRSTHWIRYNDRCWWESFTRWCFRRNYGIYQIRHSET